MGLTSANILRIVDQNFLQSGEELPRLCFQWPDVGEYHGF